MTAWRLYVHGRRSSLFVSRRLAEQTVSFLRERGIPAQVRRASMGAAKRRTMPPGAEASGPQSRVPQSKP